MSSSKETPVIRHAKTKDQYEVDAGGHTTIPVGKPAGGSYGFDHNVAGPVFIDPATNDPRDDPNAVVVDMTTLDKDAIKQAVASGADPDVVLRQFGSPASQVGRFNRQSHHPAAETAYEVPAVGLDHHRAAPPKGASMDLQQMKATLAQLTRSVEEAEHASGVPQTLPRARMPAAQAGRPYTPAPAERGPGVTRVTLQDSPRAPLASKPEEEAVFKIPGLGAMAASYHRIIDTPNFVVLVYNLTYTDGLRFMPQMTEDGHYLVLHLDEARVYEVMNVGFAFQDGLCDYLLLPKRASNDEQAALHAQQNIGEGEEGPPVENVFN